MRDLLEILDLACGIYPPGKGELRVLRGFVVDIRVTNYIFIKHFVKYELHYGKEGVATVTEITRTETLLHFIEIHRTKCNIILQRFCIVLDATQIPVV